MIDAESLISAYPAAAAATALLAGVVSSVSPCTVAAVPRVVGYVGGYAGGSRQRSFYSGALSGLVFAPCATPVMVGILALIGNQQDMSCWERCSCFSIRSVTVRYSRLVAMIAWTRILLRQHGRLLSQLMAIGAAVLVRVAVVLTQLLSLDPCHLCIFSESYISPSPVHLLRPTWAGSDFHYARAGCNGFPR